MTEEPKKVQCADCYYSCWMPKQVQNAYVCHCIASPYYDRMLNGFEKHECDKFTPQETE